MVVRPPSEECIVGVKIEFADSHVDDESRLVSIYVQVRYIAHFDLLDDVHPGCAMVQYVELVHVEWCKRVWPVHPMLDLHGAIEDDGMSDGIHRRPVGLDGR